VTNAKYAKLTTGLIIVWFLLSLTASARHVFKNDPQQPPLAFGLAVLIPVAIFVLWSASSPQFRQFLFSLNPRTLTLVQSWRIAGFTFLALYAYSLLPGTFALPAGLGDMAIGATAPLVALKLTSLNYRRSFIVWQFLGIADLVTAVGSGVSAQLINPHGVATTPMTVLPMSLIPTFAVPLFLILHFICIAQARQWQEQRRPNLGQPLHSVGL
jgi:hypothetical protein